ncbi:hypothetical protein [Stutzerimonas azotifigens]|uniref:Uncharacterized protein n=1 Tax=Stutzerimonas azotifigens TaxID=291995 RepID=A0ABR5Z6I6_9GAMM|nr:hypothetical protein [Stutzerimonas azotifigens]MBA1275831.1 hypothetical protein [Stutzerimonas azotifigens]
MLKPLFAVCAALLSSAALAQSAKVDIVSHLNGMDLVVEPMGVPLNTQNGPELVGVRAVKVTNQSDQMASCEFHMAPEDRTTAASTPTFTVDPNSQVIERVPGEYSPDRPYAEVTCEPADASSTTDSMD